MFYFGGDIIKHFRCKSCLVVTTNTRILSSSIQNLIYMMLDNKSQEELALKFIEIESSKLTGKFFLMLCVAFGLCVLVLVLFTSKFGNYGDRIFWLIFTTVFWFSFYILSCIKDVLRLYQNLNNKKEGVVLLRHSIESQVISQKKRSVINAIVFYLFVTSVIIANAFNFLNDRDGIFIDVLSIAYIFVVIFSLHFLAKILERYFKYEQLKKQILNN